MSRVYAKAMVVCVPICMAFMLIALSVRDRTEMHLFFYIAVHQRASDRQIYMLQLERGLSVSVTHEAVIDTLPRLSPDGQWLIYMTSSDTQHYSLLNLQTGEKRTLPPMPRPLSIATIMWSANADLIGFQAFEANGSLIWMVYDLDGQTLEEVMGADISSTLPIPIGFISPIPGMPIPLEVGADFEDWQMVTLDDEGFPRFTDAYSPDESPSFNINYSGIISLSPDGQWFAATLDRPQQRDLFLIPVWEGVPINLTNDSDVETSVSWSRDGRYLAYMVQNRAEREIRIMDVASREIVFRSDMIVASNQFAWASRD